MSKVPFSAIAKVNPSRNSIRVPLDTPVSFIPMEDVSESGQWYRHRYRQLKDVQSGFTAFSENDVLFAKITPCMENGKGCIANGLINGIGFGSTEFHVLRAINGNDPRFVFHWAQSRELRLKAEAFMIGSAGQQRVQASFFEKFEVPAFSPDEQRRIALILDTADLAISKTEAVIAKLENMKTGLLHDLLTRGIDENGELRDIHSSKEFKTVEHMGLVPKSWTVCRLDEVADVQRGKFTHRPRNDPDYYGGSFPFVQTGDVAAAGGERLYNYSQTLSYLGASISRVFPIETIAITIAANIADTAILGIPMYFPDSVVAAVVKAPNIPRFIELCIRKSKRSLSALAPQSAQKNINLTDLRPLHILLPRPDEQERIAEKYEAIQKRIVTETEIAEKYKSLKQGLLSDLLTGKKQLHQVVGAST
jgi:type I restriction enzyme S subunit